MLAVGTVALHGGGPADSKPKELVCWEEILRRVGKRPIGIVHFMRLSICYRRLGPVLILDTV